MKKCHSQNKSKIIQISTVCQWNKTLLWRSTEINLQTQENHLVSFGIMEITKTCNLIQITEVQELYWKYLKKDQNCDPLYLTEIQGEKPWINIGKNHPCIIPQSN